jgi:outer membrane protein assembly factor BamB
VAPAVAPDGTIYTVSRAHGSSRYAYLVAVNADLTPKWAASLRDHLSDGCGVLLAIGGPGGCRPGQPANGVDPQTNQAPAGRVIDQSSSSPTVLPDGSILYGAYTRYNYARGHLFRFSAAGSFLAAYDFGWDSTPAVYSHDGTYSIVIKDNHYDAGSYCNSATICPPAAPGPYYITQLTASLTPEWRFQNTNTQSCQRNPDGTLSCVTDHPNGFEWCINAPAIDGTGVVYANSEDGNLYAINQGGTLKQRTFLNLAIGAAYTPLSISAAGLIYTENDGHLFVVGAGGGPARDHGHGSGASSPRPPDTE